MQLDERLQEGLKPMAPFLHDSLTAGAEESLGWQLQIGMLSGLAESYIDTLVNGRVASPSHLRLIKSTMN